MRGGSVLLVSLLFAAAPGTAHAGRTFYGWMQGTEVMPERGAELQSWISEENGKPGDAYTTDWLVTPAIGITDQLELGLPLTFAWDRSMTDRSRTVFDNFGAELRYRLVTQDPVDAPAFVPLVRVALKRLVGNRDGVRPEANITASYETGPVHMLADVGMVGEIDPDTHHFEVHPGAGISVLAVEDLRFGAEVFASLSLDSKEESWAIAGPNISWTHGRFWLSAVYGIGLYQITDAPRIQWGIAF